MAADGGKSHEGVARVVIRPATAADVEGILGVQEPGALAGLAHIFPQDRHPFPRAAVADRWREELADAVTAVYVSVDQAGRLTGFAARREDELLHFGTAVDLWGTALARHLHDTLLTTFPRSLRRVRLRVFAANHRARRFYEKAGWTVTGATSRTRFPPHPVLLEYERSIG